MPHDDAPTPPVSLTDLGDWSDPVGSEARFRALAAGGPPELRLLAQTQVARALGLQGRYVARCRRPAGGARVVRGGARAA